MEPGQLSQARSILATAVAERSFPGAVLAVGHKGEIAFLPIGYLSYESDSPPVTTDTIYDLASLTKVVATTTAAMLLVERGKLALDLPAGTYLPDFIDAIDPDDSLSDARAEVTIRHLLAHTSGLPAYERFFLRAREKSHVLAEAQSLPIVATPGEKTGYSDVGFILLGAILEQVAGENLDTFCETEIFQSLGMKDTLFNPPEELWSRIAPTEYDHDFRKRLIQGEVHDENAWVMGGVAGHAGLFGTAPDLARFCSMLLAGGTTGGNEFLKPETIQEFTRPYPASEGAPRGLGWDKPSENSSSGSHFSSSSYGHLGFTGTSIWIDPEANLFVVLLTNRVHPTRTNEAIRQIRPHLHDAVVLGVGLN